MFSEEVYLDLLCSSVGEPESEPEPFFEKVGAGAVFPKSHTAPQHCLEQWDCPLTIFSGHRTRYWWGMTSFLDTTRGLSTDLWWGLTTFLDNGIVNWPSFLDTEQGIVNWPMMRHDIFSGHRIKCCQRTCDEAWHLFWTQQGDCQLTLTSFLDPEQRDCQLNILSGPRQWDCHLTILSEPRTMGLSTDHLFWTQNKVLSTDLWWGLTSILDTEQSIVNWTMMRPDIFSGHNKGIVNWPMLRHDVFSGHRTRYFQLTYDEEGHLFWT